MHKLHSYRVYVEHPYGTDKLNVGLKVRDVKKAGEEGRMRAIRLRKCDPRLIRVLDVIPLRFVNGKLVETRKPRSKHPTTVTRGKFKTARKPKARVTRRTTKRRSA